MAMTKAAIADALATMCKGKKSKVLDALAELAIKKAMGTGKFTIPGVCKVWTKHEPATKVGKRMAFGKEVRVKAQTAVTVVKFSARKEAVRGRDRRTLL